MFTATYIRLIHRISFLIFPDWLQRHTGATPSTRARRTRHLRPDHSTKTPNTGLATLPPEIHHMITSYLPYPDLLSLKLTDKYFSELVSPKLNVKTRVQWVQSRVEKYLPVPISTKLSFKSDVLFVGNKEVNVILRRRRKHLECVDYDKDQQRVLMDRVFTVAWDAHGRSREFITARAQIHPVWAKSCLVTGEKICPRICEMKLKKGRYENSWAGKAASLVRLALESRLKVSQWFRGLWRSLIHTWRGQ